MNTNALISDAFNRLALDTGPYRTDDKATVRIATALVSEGYHREHATIYVADMRQGRGRSVWVGDAYLLNVTVTTRRAHYQRENVNVSDLYDVLTDALTNL